MSEVVIQDIIQNNENAISIESSTCVLFFTPTSKII
jgi:hypothetical protein